MRPMRNSKSLTIKSQVFYNSTISRYFDREMLTTGGCVWGVYLCGCVRDFLPFREDYSKKQQGTFCTTAVSRNDNRYESLFLTVSVDINLFNPKSV